MLDICNGNVYFLHMSYENSIQIWLLMHLQMQRDVWLDNVINLQQYILRYTVENPVSLRNVAFHWLTSEYMQLASGFMQLAAAGRIGATKYIFTVFSKGKFNYALEWGWLYSIFSFGEVYRLIYVRKSRFTAPLTRRRKTKFLTVYQMIYLPKWKFWIQLSPNLWWI